MAIFSSLVTGTMGMFGTYAYQVSGAQREYYPVTEQCVVYDMSANLIPMTSQGTVKRDWSVEWELKLEDGSTFDLGENAVAYKIVNLNGIDSWQNVYVVLNAGKAEVTLPLPAGSYHAVVANGKADEKGLWGITAPSSGTSVAVAPQSALIIHD